MIVSPICDFITRWYIDTRPFLLKPYGNKMKMTFFFSTWQSVYLGRNQCLNQTQCQPTPLPATASTAGKMTRVEGILYLHLYEKYKYLWRFNRLQYTILTFLLRSVQWQNCRVTYGVLRWQMGQLLVSTEYRRCHVLWLYIILQSYKKDCLTSYSTLQAMCFIMGKWAYSEIGKLNV